MPTWVAILASLMTWSALHLPIKSQRLTRSRRLIQPLALMRHHLKYETTTYNYIYMTSSFSLQTWRGKLIWLSRFMIHEVFSVTKQCVCYIYVFIIVKHQMQLCVCNSMCIAKWQFLTNGNGPFTTKKWNNGNKFLMQDITKSFQEDYNNRKGDEPVGVSNAGNNLWAKSAAKWSNWSS